MKTTSPTEAIIERNPAITPHVPSPVDRPTDPFAIMPISQAQLDLLETRLPRYKESIHNRRLLGDPSRISKTEREELAFQKPTIVAGIYVDDFPGYLKLRCAKFLIGRGLVPTTRQMVAEEMQRQTDQDFSLFPEAAIVKLGKDLAIATNSFRFEVCKNYQLGRHNFELSDIFSGLRARLMGVAKRTPRYIEYAEPERVLSGSLTFVDPNRHHVARGERTVV